MMHLSQVDEISLFVNSNFDFHSRLVMKKQIEVNVMFLRGVRETFTGQKTASSGERIHVSCLQSWMWRDPTSRLT